MSDKLKLALADCDEDTAMAAIDELEQAGIAAEQIVAVCNEGMGLLGQRFDEGEAFIPDLMFGGMLMKKIMERLTPKLSGKTDSVQKAGKVIIGTVQHDVHDIGKDITAMVFRGNGFDVIDLGVDVPPEKFAAAVQEHKPDVVGLSVLLTTCYKSVQETMDALNKAGLRDTVKICIGGAAASELVAQRTGIDFYAKTAVEGVNWAKKCI
ncbi:MAG: cobalamin-dependent protein [Planctomycetaceae bacterium]|jgi:5-methyltetrahydrofolate--homocysteine methyltransferase|nr:cobalamin-dependent protein [Planctomycetaceae bacterium]